MSCCGDRRAELARTGLRGRAYVPVVRAARTPAGRTQLTYRGPVPMALRGPVSREIYRLTAAGPVTLAAPDVPAMVRTGWFEAPTA